MTTKTLDLWVVLGTMENVGSFAHVFEEDDSGLLYVSDGAFVSDGRRMYVQSYQGIRVIQKDRVLAEGITEEQYMHLVRLSMDAKKARRDAYEQYKKALLEAQADVDRTYNLIHHHYETMFDMVVSGAFKKNQE